MPDATTTDSSDYSDGRRTLGQWLNDQFATYCKDRKGAEDQWMQNLRQFLGKYDPSYEQNMDQNTSRAYPKVTRVKCMSTKARLMSLLFPAGEKNWGLQASPIPNLPVETLQAALDAWRRQNPNKNPTQSELDQLVLTTAHDIAALMEKVIDDQLQDADAAGTNTYEALCGQVVASGILYGPGIVKGPMAVAERHTSYQLDAQGMVQIVEVDAYRPYLEFVSCWDYYPDMSAANFDQLDGEYQRHVYSRHQLLALAERGDFYGDVIRAYVTAHPDGNYQRTNAEQELQALGGQNAAALPRGTKFQLLEYWGSCDSERLAAAGLTIPEALQGKDLRFTAWTLDNEVVKLALNPLPEGTKLYHQFIFEDDEVNLLGSGLPPIMRDSQLAVSSGARMLIDNASVVCGPNVEVDTDLLALDQQDLSIKARKVWKTEQANGRRAVQSISFDSHIPELLNLINTFMDFADSETFVNPLTGGDLDGVSGEALRTTRGASMAYGNAALPFRDIVRNFDRFTTSVIHALVQWNLIFSPQRERLAGDTRPLPKGATSLMAKEVRAFALDQLASTLTPEDRLYLNDEALLRQRLMVRDLPLAELMAPESEVQARKDARAAQAAKDQAMADAMFQANLRNINSDSLKQTTQAQKNLDASDVQVFKALMEAIQNGASPEELAAVAQRITTGRRGTQAPPADGSVRSLPDRRGGQAAGPAATAG